MDRGADEPKQLIPGAVAVAIVGFLEVIDIDREHGEPLLVRPLGHALGQAPAVGQRVSGSVSAAV